MKNTKSTRKDFWEMGKKILRPLLAILVFLGVMYLGTQIYASWQNVRQSLEDVHKLQYAELNDILSMREAFSAECESANTIRNYLLLPQRDCHLSSAEEPTEKEETLEEALYFYFTLLKSKEEKEAAQERILQIVEEWNARVETPASENAADGFVNEFLPTEEFPPSEEVNGNIPPESGEEARTPFLIDSSVEEAGENLQITLRHGEDEVVQVTFFPLEKTYHLAYGEKTEEFSDFETFKAAVQTLLETAEEHSLLPKEPEENASPPVEGDTPIELNEESFEESDSETEDFSALLRDESLQKYVDSLGFDLTIKEDPTGNILATIEENGQVLRQFSQDPKSGEIMASLPDGSSSVKLLGLRALVQQEVEQSSEPDISEFQGQIIGKQNGRQNYALLGHNGGNVDTIILAHVDHSHKRITLISVPRDLFVDGYKINGYYGKYGIQAFISKLEEVIGQRVSFYVLIDFDIFMDGIDALGGINIYFPRDVADPTYKTFDNNEWGTMYFEKGTHHLSGVQALRLARSRATSSDFERARRQQQILLAAREKAQALSLRNANTIISLIRVMMNRVKTNLTPQEAISRFFGLKDYEVRSGSVMSTQNILTSTVNEATKQYILLPRNGGEGEEPDWDLIKKYIWREVLAE